ncbi:hypothetical protein HDU91_003825, partial [Kappamyces sp. JEL0680]
VIIKEDPAGILTKSSFVVHRLLFKQKLYNFCVPLLLASFERANADRKKYHLLALSHLLRNIAKKTLVNELPKRVRVQSIHLLGLLPGKIEYSVLAPYRTQVLQALLHSLDDHKRVVRREGANSRSKWFLMLGQPQE